MEMKDVRRLFVDTNILIFATDDQSELHLAAEKTLHEARQVGTELIISPQILREYLAVGTRIRQMGKGPPLSKLLENVRTHRSEFFVVEDSPSVLDTLIDLLQRVTLGFFDGVFWNVKMQSNHKNRAHVPKSCSRGKPILRNPR